MKEDYTDTDNLPPSFEEEKDYSSYPEYTVLHDYKKKEEGELSIREGEVVRLIDYGGYEDWCIVVNEKGNEGYVSL